ncbi:50S ribosomal protein L35 [Dehalogenimonas etheniformans]|uniref:Large ribosomal subunit protein bL35 n=1 Tax=Dehalogenimonas etheniformans TaxID=1536648 RepID=A0A2P5P9H9_9CHLR|nr:50S ribosomal protein L35 [Dehalogenimonas etheniformans]PPD58956.1 50S ribosomal protein L35 [Dehalogenimonas etheniformans]QNT76276.1 50S ribosomal protein L35 [Dehalogenimonas etheniformans]
MPKLKTHKGAQNRFKLTGNGKMMRMKGLKSHLRRNKSKRARRQFDEMIPMAKADVQRLSRLIPYGTP